MPSADVTYSAVQVDGGVFNYEVNLHNLGPAPFDIYDFMFGWHFNLPIVPPFPFADATLISAPSAWDGHFDNYAVHWGTNYQGSSAASGYVIAGHSAIFRFQSSTPPPTEVNFGCGYYNNANQWGFNFNGIAKYDDNLLREGSFFYAYINPLALLIGDACSPG